MDMRIGTRTAAPHGVCADARSGRNQALVRAHGQKGQSLVEFALVLPILLALLIGVVVFGIALNHYLVLTNATTAGVQALSIARGQTINPCTTVTGPFYGAAPNLTQANLLFTITITPPPGGSGTSYTLVSLSRPPPRAQPRSTTMPPASDLIQNYTATVTVTYPCNLTFLGFNFAPGGCTLTAQTAEVVQ